MRLEKSETLLFDQLFCLFWLIKEGIDLILIIYLVLHHHHFHFQAKKL